MVELRYDNADASHAPMTPCKFPVTWIRPPPHQPTQNEAHTTRTAHFGALAWIHSTPVSPFTVSFLIPLVCLLVSFDGTALDTSTAAPSPTQTRTRAPRQSIVNKNETNTARTLRVCARAPHARPVSIFVSPQEHTHGHRADALTERSPFVAPSCHTASLLARAGLDAQAP